MGKVPALDVYEAKRDFRKTAEPRDAAGVEPSERLRFVIQRHDATRLHYDLRLELAGVFKSWAVTKGPSLNPADKRLAVETEDHPLGYGDFEGTIPKGQYGGGTVQLFDRGYWAPENGDPAAALAGGELKFALDGTHLKGSFVLVRMKNDRFARGTASKRTNWLLIKHRDEAANDGEDGGGVLVVDASVASGRSLATIAAGKGKAPKPFMLAADKAPAPNAIWTSSAGLAHEARVAAATAGAVDEPARDVSAKNGRPKATAPARSAAKRSGPKAAAKPRGAAKTVAAGRRRKTAVADPLPDFVPPQLCRTLAKPPLGADWLHEIKFDGYRVQIRVEGGAARLLTRTGLDWTAKFGALAAAAKTLPDCILDGEVVALDGDGKPNFSALQAALAAGRPKDLLFFAFDLLHCDGEDLREDPLRERKARLAELLDGGRGDPFRYVEHLADDGAAVFASARNLGLEGVVSKRVDAPYRSGRSDTWTRAKCRPAEEVVVGAWTDTGGKFRSLLGGVFRHGKLAYVGRIGSGFSAAVVAAIMPRLKAQARDKSPFDPKAAPPRDRAIHWLEPTLVAEIEFAGWTADGWVRQAAFKGFRDDKDAAEVVGDPPAAAASASGATEPQGATAASGTRVPARPVAAAGRVVVSGVTLSHPDKALWPDANDGAPVTKRDLAQYFEAVGAWMLPHIAERPCSVIRAPDGIDGETFFQRHAMPGGSKLLGTVVISGDRKPYIVIDTVAALAAVAQSGGIELHPSNCAPGAPMTPGRLVFDLDPSPDLPFVEVIKAAKELKSVLETIGLTPFCKTTGGKGLHLVTPLAATKTAVNWAAAKAFAHDVCLALERGAPDRYLTKQSKAARKGRIYLDYLRNDRLSTAVAPLSPRGRPHAPVSMPLTWAQVKADLDPTRYTLRSVPGLLARSKAWADYDAAARPIAEAMDRLKRL